MGHFEGNFPTWAAGIQESSKKWLRDLNLRYMLNKTTLSYYASSSELQIIETNCQLSKEDSSQK